MKLINNYILEKLHIGKDSNFREYFNVIEISKMMQKILIEEYKIDIDDIYIHLYGSKCLKMELFNYKYYYDKGIVPDAKRLLPELIRKYENAGILFDEKPTLNGNSAFIFKIRNMK